jgi:hypothetical protein
MPSDEFDFDEILRVLVRFRVDFIVVGGLCAVLHGAPIHTRDLDIVPSQRADNLERLVAALADIDTYYREHSRTRLRPVAARLAGPGHHLLKTSYGSLDVLGSIANGRDYETLLPHSVEVPLGDDLRIRLLDLPTLIATKRETGREKDKLVLPILQRTLEEVGRMPGEAE